MGMLLLIVVLSAPPLAGQVVSITDGDTLTVLDSQNVRHKIRLRGIDAPERKQPFGTAARKHLGELCQGKRITVETHGRDRYGRTIGTIGDVNRRMVADGYAWWYRRYAPNDKALEAAEAEARSAKRGLWSQEAVKPWRWRKQRVASLQYGAMP